MKPPIEIYGRDDCRFCAAARAWCEKRRYRHVYHDMTADASHMDVLVDRLGKQPASVPQIFIGDHHIGGYVQLAASEVAIQEILGGE